MKIKFILSTFLALAACILFCSLNSGTAYGGLGDITGSPLSTMTCSGGGCHGGGNYGTLTSIQVLDSVGNIVSTYRPGETYTLEINVSSSTGSPAGYGAQAVVLDTANAQAGDLDSIQTLNTRITSYNGRKYLEQFGLNSGALRVRWTAPAPGTGQVTVYAAGVAVDGWGNMTDDEPSAAVSISLNEAAGLYYSQSFLCANASNPTAILTGLTPGGTFSAVPPNIVFADTLGTINLLTSDTGSYTIYYNENGNIDSVSLRILQSDWALISYDPTNASHYIDNVTGDSIFQLACFGIDPSPIILGEQGGIFSTTAALMLDSISGSISNISFAPTLVTYTTNGVCSHIDSFWVVRDCSVNTEKIGKISSFSLFPNPSSDGVFYIENSGETSETSIEIYNSQGQNIDNLHFLFEAASLYTLSLPEESPAGFYFLRLRQGQKVQTFKLLRE